MTLYRIYKNDELFMIAPTNTLKLLLNMHSDAIRRIERECKDEGECILHYSRRPIHGVLRVIRHPTE